MHGYNRVLRYINKGIHFTDALYSKRAHNLILNVMRCETHREVLESILEKEPVGKPEKQSKPEKKDAND